MRKQAVKRVRAEMTDKTETTEKQNFIKHDAKDSVFRDLFSQPEYLFQLYQALHPEDKETVESDLSIVTLERILVNREYNDLGFQVGNKLIILVESQSTWTENIVIRSLIYLMSSYQDYFNDRDINLYGSKKIKMPKPELYVIYTKDRDGHPDTISLKEEYFPNEDCCIEAKVKIIYEDASGKVTSQYIGFCKVFDDCVKKYGRTHRAIEETLRICKDKNLLKEYLEKRETEVKGIMLTLFNQERVTELYGMEMREEGRAEGREEGIGIGRKEGIGIGREEGRAEGYADAYLAMIRKNLLSKEIAAQELGISIAELEQKLAAYGLE